MQDDTRPAGREGKPRRRRLPIMLVFGLAAAVAVVWVTNRLLTERFLEATRNRAEVRLEIYAGNIRTELQRTAIVPLLLSQDPALIEALSTEDFSQSTQRLIFFRDEIGLDSVRLLNAEGRTMAATDRTTLGSTHRNAPYFVEALRSSDTVFTVTPTETGAQTFAYSRKIRVGTEQLGVIVVAADLAKFEQIWASFNDAMIVTNSEGEILLSTERSWRGVDETAAIEIRSPETPIARALQVTADWTGVPSDVLGDGEGLIRQELRLDFQGWRMVSFTAFSSVRERVNAVLALEIMGFAILLAGLFYLVSRKDRTRLVFFQRESEELRELNEALQHEISERERAEKNLETAEQTLQQSQKLAILGEMSASVSHELNQPLAAMKTYLAGAKLLLQRRRGEEALSSFQRIDDLIERMGAITRQLKSYARKGGTAVEPIDVRDSVSAAIAMMEPQLRTRSVRASTSMPRDPVRVEADRIRLEQVLVNLLRNAIDAMKDVDTPQIRVLVSVGESVLISVRDNGHGIEDLDALFEPFYTTKPPGDGVGLGLAISSGIVADFGGRLTARNGRDGGAVFEVRLPRAGWSTAEAAE